MNKFTIFNQLVKNVSFTKEQKVIIFILDEHIYVKMPYISDMMTEVIKFFKEIKGYYWYTEQKYWRFPRTNYEDFINFFKSKLMYKVYGEREIKYLIEAKNEYSSKNSIGQLKIDE
jgi:hypothetical protein